MWNDFLDNARAFPKLNNMEKNYIEVASGTQLETSLIIFSTWMLIELNPGLYVQKSLVESQKSCRRLLEIFVFSWKGKNIFLPIRY